MKYYSTNFKLFATEKTLRSSFNYQILANKQENNNSPFYTFDELFSVSCKKINIDDIDGVFSYCQIGDVRKDGISNPIILNFEERSILYESYYKKIEKGDIMSVEEGDILMSFLIPYDFSLTGKFARIASNEKKVFYSTAFIDLKPKKIPVIMYYALKNVFYNDFVSIARIGKGYTGYATIASDDLKQLRFDKAKVDILIKNEDEINRQISLIESKKRELMSNSIDNDEIINNIFSDYFNYDKRLIYDVHKGMTFGTQKNGNTNMSVFEIDFSQINDKKLRMSTRTNNETIKKVMDILHAYGIKKLKDVIYEQTHRGKSPKYDINGTIPVIKTAHITSNGLNNEFSEFVSEEFYNSKKDSKLKKGDLLLTSTGKPSIGKIDMYDYNEPMIPDGHVSIIRINPKKYNPKFFMYFIRSVLGYTQLEKEFVGCTNQIELYSDSIDNLVIPDIPLSEQQSIADKIENLISSQNEIDLKIQNYDSDIKKIIESYVN